MGIMAEDYKEEFLKKTRYGYLTTLTKSGAPKTVPIWFDWDEHAVRIFSVVGTVKLKRIENDPRVTVLVASDMDEHEAWVSFDGHAEIRSDGAIELVEKLADRYWDLSDPEKRETIERWKTMPEIFRVIEIVPTKIRTYLD